MVSQDLLARHPRITWPAWTAGRRAPAVNGAKDRPSGSPTGGCTRARLHWRYGSPALTSRDRHVPASKAARLVGARSRTVRRWLKGYSRRHGEGRRASAPLWDLQYAADEELGDEQVLGFHDLLELRTVAKFVEQGVPLPVIRATIEVAREYLGDYPLHSRRFVTDGRKIFLEAVERLGEDPKLLDVRGRQFAIDAVIRPCSGSRSPQ